MTCPLCGNKIKATDEECQCGGPMPDGCPFNQSGFHDFMREFRKKFHNSIQELRKRKEGKS